MYQPTADGWRQPVAPVPAPLGAPQWLAVWALLSAVGQAVERTRK